MFCALPVYLLTLLNTYQFDWFLHETFNLPVMILFYMMVVNIVFQVKTFQVLCQFIWLRRKTLDLANSAGTTRTSLEPVPESHIKSSRSSYFPWLTTERNWISKVKSYFGFKKTIKTTLISIVHSLPYLRWWLEIAYLICVCVWLIICSESIFEFSDSSLDTVVSQVTNR